MSVGYLRKASETPETKTATSRNVVNEILAAIEKDKDAAVRDYTLKLDKWRGYIVMFEARIAEGIKNVPAGVRADIDFVLKQVSDFALAQKKPVSEFSVEFYPWYRRTARPPLQK